MRRSRIPVVCLWLAAASCAGLAGCPQPKPPAVHVQPFAGRTVTVAAPRGLGFKERWEAAINDWQAQTGGAADVLEIDSLAAAPAAGGTVEIVPWTRLGRRVLAGPLSVIPGATDSGIRGGSQDGGSPPNGSAGANAAAGPDVFHLYQGLRDSVISPAKRPSLFPVCTPVLTLYYRADLLRKAGRSPPETWDEYRQLLADLGQWAPKLFAVEPWAPDFRATMFFARAAPYARHPANYSVFFDVETGRPLIASQAFQTALTEAAADLKLLSPDSLTATPEDCERHIVEGRAALAIALETGPGRQGWAFGTQASKPPGPRAAEIEIGLAPLPGARKAFNGAKQAWTPVTAHRVTLAGFAGFAVCVPDAEEKTQVEMAWNLAAWLWSSDQLAAHPPGTVSLTSDALANDVALWSSAGLVTEEQFAYTQAVAGSLRNALVVLELPVIERDRFRDAVAKQLTAVIEGQAVPADALAACQAEWLDISMAAGTDRVRESYRLSIGLRPKLGGLAPLSERDLPAGSATPPGSRSSPPGPAPKSPFAQ